MNYAIEVLKNAFDEREIRMRNALNMSCSESDTGYYRDRYIELEKQVKDLEKALEVLSREKGDKI